MDRKLNPLIKVIHGTLAIPAAYDLMQRAVGGVRLNSRFGIEGLSLGKNFGIQQVIDVGCGPKPANYRNFIINNWEYLGMDFDGKYVDRAKRFVEQENLIFQRDVTEPWNLNQNFPRPTLVILAGLYHHLSDDQLEGLFSQILNNCTKDSYIYSYDPVITAATSKIGAWFARNDRGAFLRDGQAIKKIGGIKFEYSFDYRQNQVRTPVDFIFSKLKVI